ncbi:inositol monophosphatase [Halogeometricum borinquense]|uniref:fructose-bisphosphatase n=2 Tax=Halogeometricum borinquense TaxID=60847 RepID=A0A6C0UJV0_9EURY|nr:inositol monophosphatase [Halogeometricum borinquense]QIQ76663.1 inositol monophosphatase [Halogeometricum borinquense]
MTISPVLSDSRTMTDRVRVAEAAAAAGADVAMAMFERDIEIEEKSSKTDVVSEADGAAQDEILTTIADHYPDDVVVGEEGNTPKEIPETGDSWVVDPIDGTSNYLHGFTVWCQAVAAVRDASPVAAAVTRPAVGETYVADDTEFRKNGDPTTVSDESDPERFVVAPTLRVGDDNRDQYLSVIETCFADLGDLRRIGSAQLTLAMVAAGSIDVALGIGRSHPWDTVAGVHMIRTAGGTVTDLDGNPWRHDSDGLVASNGQAHDAVLDAFDF